ncbi:AAA family ATPase [Streptococcus oralis]|uniref:AAA family ATPase n=1 Tax=Streptococcus oralis TaxID=1303 RepID=UPI001F1CF9D3|nr:AAA family ATPase [Streptococcus oralis]UJC99795.1 AAA family ATPase [Streptococcus oralis]
MKLIALVIKQYDELFKNQIFNFSDEYKVDFNFETNKLKIDKNLDYIENFYGDSIYNISPIVGINGIGKTTVLNIISGYSPAKREQDSDNQYFFLFEIGKQEDKVRFKVSSNNLSVATLQEYWGQTFYRNQDGSFDCDPEGYDVTRNILYVNLPSKGKGGVIESRTTLNQKGLAMFIHSYLWLSDRNIISSVLSCSLDISTYGLKDNTNSIPRGIKAIGFLIYKSIHNIFYEEDEFIKKLLSESLLDECEKYLKEDVSDYEDSGFNLLLDIVKELNQNEVKEEENKLKDETRKVKKDYVESIIDIVNIFREIRENGSLIDNKSSSILLKYSNNNRSLFEELNDRLFQHTKSKKLVDKFCYDLNENFNNYYLLKETPDYHMSTGEGNLIEIFSQLYTYLYMHEESSEDIILLVDELESGMHLEWSRRLIKILINNLSEILEDEGKGRKIQLIFTTHSPYMLSDIKPGNVIMIEKNQETGYSEGKVLQNTFAKNIQEIMKENLIDNIYGDFALAKINSMIERLNGEEEQEGNEEELLKEIHLISEPILRNKLLEMYDKKYNTSEFSIEKQLQKLNLNEEQREQVRAMIKENISNADADK